MRPKSSRSRNFPWWHTPSECGVTDTRRRKGYNPDSTHDIVGCTPVIMNTSARFAVLVVLLWAPPVAGPAALAAGETDLPPITGGRPFVPPEFKARDRFSVLERNLQEELLAPEGDDETLAFLSRGGFSDEGQIVVRYRAGRGSLSFMPDGARSFERTMSAEEFRELRAFLLGRRALDLKELKTDVADGIEYELLHLTRTGGKRVYMNNPGVVGARPYLEIRERFRRLLGKPGMALHYRAQRDSPDLEVLFSDPDWNAVGVRFDGNQLLLQVERGYRRAGGDLAMPSSYQLKCKLPTLEVRESEWVTWPQITGVEHERLVALSLARIPVPKKIHSFEWLNRGGWASEQNGVRYVVGQVGEKEGLWRVLQDGKFDFVVAGKMSTPLVSLDGKAIVVDRTDLKSWGHSSYFARIDLPTAGVQRVAIATANEMMPLMPTSNGVLVRRARADTRGLPSDWNFQGPETPEYYLVDSGSGSAKKVEGNFTSLPTELTNPLQAAGPGRVWSVSADWEKEKSTIGTFDLKGFSFTPVRDLTGLALRTNDIWVDEHEGKVYAVYRGDLVRFSLQGKHDLLPKEERSPSRRRP